ncbi:hypothetical protein Tco_0662281 [Tanacetum coccineum]
MPDNRTMAQLLEASTEGYEDAIVVPEITADNFKLKHDQDSLNSCRGSNGFGENAPDCLRIIESKIQGSGSLPSNTIANLNSDLKAITTRSGVSYQGPTIPTTYSSLPKVVERETEVTKDMVPPTNNGSTKDVQPTVVQI